MHYSCLGDPIRAYPKFLVLISIALGYLGCSNSLIGNYRPIILYWGADFSIKYSILLYRLLMTFV